MRLDTSILLVSIMAALCGCDGLAPSSNASGGASVHRGVDNDTFLGQPSWKTQAELYVEHWAKDGGGLEQVPAPEGHAYLVFGFEDPPHAVEPFDVIKNEYGLMLPDATEELHPDGFTVTQQPADDFAIFAQASRRGTVRLNTRPSGDELPVSTQK